MIDDETRPENAGSNPKPLYATHDLGLSAFLQVRGHEIIEILSQGGRGVFVFIESAKLRKDVLRWGNDQPVTLRVRAFVNSQRDLKGLVGAVQFGTR